MRHGHEPPDLRATIRGDGVIRAVRWYRSLEIGGPSATLLDSRDRAGVTIADLSFIRAEPALEPEFEPGDLPGCGPEGAVTEVVVAYLCGGGEHARPALVDWAALVGIGRVWFPTGVEDVEPITPGKVEVRCSSCRGRLVDGLPSFWAFVRRNGHFPTSCPLCGADLPQWRPVTSRRAPARRAAALELVGGTPAA